MVLNMIGLLLSGKGASHERKHRLIPRIDFRIYFDCSICAINAVSPGWYLAAPVKRVPILLALLGSWFQARQELDLQEISQILKAGNDSIITYSPRYKSADKTKDSLITPPTAIPQLLVTYGPTKREIPSFSGGYQYIRGRRGDSRGCHCGAEPLSPIWSERCRTSPYVKLDDISWDCGEHGPRFGHGSDIILAATAPRNTMNRSQRNSPCLFRQLGLFYPGYNSAALLSSDMSSYEEAGILRGFRVNCRWDEQQHGGIRLRSSALMLHPQKSVTRQTDSDAS